MIRNVIAGVVCLCIVASMSACSHENLDKAYDGLSSTLDYIESGVAGGKEAAKQAVSLLRENGVDFDALQSAVETVKTEANAQIDEMGARPYFDTLETEMSDIKACYEKMRSAYDNPIEYNNTSSATLASILNNSNVNMDFAYITIEDNKPAKMYIFNYAKDVNSNQEYGRTTEINLFDFNVADVISTKCMIRANAGEAYICDTLLKTKQAVASADAEDVRKNKQAFNNANGLLNLLNSSNGYVSSALDTVVSDENFSMNTFRADSGVFYTYVFSSGQLRYVITEELGQWGVFIISNLTYGNSADISKTDLTAYK